MGTHDTRSETLSGEGNGGGIGGGREIKRPRTPDDDKLIFGARRDVLTCCYAHFYSKAEAHRKENVVPRHKECQNMLCLEQVAGRFFKERRINLKIMITCIRHIL
jgi:hypothetical protein